MQKAFKWLDAHQVKYEFHNYKQSGIDKATLQVWLQHFDTGKLINTKGTTFKALTAEEQAGMGNKTKAIACMIKSPSLIKRPVWDFGNGTFFLGWNETEVAKLVG